MLPAFCIKDVNMYEENNAFFNFVGRLFGVKTLKNVSIKIIKKYGGSITEENVKNLSESERTVCVLYSFLMDLSEGGFLKYFNESGVVSSAYLCDSLKNTGMAEEAEKLEKYCDENGIELDNIESIEKFDYNKQGNGFDLKLLKTVSELDGIVDLDKAEKLLKAYVKRNF